MFAGASAFGLDLGGYLLNAFATSRATTTGLGVEVTSSTVLRLSALTTSSIITASMAKHLQISAPFFAGRRSHFATVIGDGGLQGFAAHDRAVHLFRRQAVEVIGDVLIETLSASSSVMPLMISVSAEDEAMAEPSQRSGNARPG